MFKEANRGVGVNLTEDGHVKLNLLGVSSGQSSMKASPPIKCYSENEKM